MKLNFEQLDVLQEIASIGAAHSATALSKLLERKIMMNVPEVRAVSFNELTEAMGGAEKEVACIFLRMNGSISGSMYFIMEMDSAEFFLREFARNSSLSLRYPLKDEYARSALIELGNILMGSYLNSLSELTNLLIIPEVPEFTVDMFGAIISEGLIGLSNAADFAVLIRTMIMGGDGLQREPLQGHLFLLPDHDSFESFYRAAGVQDED
ncbi:CheY-P-specific phosphatase CheC [Bacillus mangrovi]|uniref:CheY-P-specific phosphatase CheC n=1 Tax=Metabacillus mangrovi TaxID=1491830 RepID=A0A7X2S3W3_9BACI|nr:chemotaxis protein CheC [Metabacillus mangrovi]MTH52766.1 CheY-P-specific phosphatase CheC [Metabacillus mangrovi]